jgi:hypothetical protein
MQAIYYIFIVYATANLGKTYLGKTRKKKERKERVSCILKQD